MAHNADTPLTLLRSVPDTTEPECIHDEFGLTNFAVTVDPVCIPLDPFCHAEHRTSVNVGHGVVHVRLYLHQFRERAELRGNAAKISDKHGLSQVPVDRLPDLIGQTLDRLEPDLMFPPGSLSRARVTELTITRSLSEVASSDSWIRSLAQEPITRCSERRVRYSASGKAQSYEVSAQTGGTLEVDTEHATYPYRAPRGYVHWQVHARRRWLVESGIRTLTDVTAESITRLATHRWEWMSSSDTPPWSHALPI